MNARIRSQGARVVFFLLPNPFLRPVEDEAFMTLFDNSSFSLAHAPFASRRSQKTDWSESPCLGWFPYLFAEGTVDRVEAFTVLGRKLGTNWVWIPLEPLLKVVVTWFSEDYFRNHDVELAVAS